MSDEQSALPTPEIVQGHAGLSGDARIKQVGALEAAEGGAWSFKLTALVPQPNVEDLPAEVVLRVVIPTDYPFAPVGVYAESPEIRGFHHQDAETHKLCLREERLAPCNHGRLSIYVAWSLEWLHDASSGQLLPSGHPYELPDFSRKLLKEKPPLKKKLWFSESPGSYPHWKDRQGQTGRVELIDLKNAPAVLAASFKFGKEVIWKFPAAPTFDTAGTKTEGRWLVLPSLAYFRNRPPQRFGELRKMCAASGIDLNPLLEDLWASDTGSSGYSILLVGAGIPRIAGEPSYEMHWQPLAIRNVNCEAGLKAAGKGPVKRRQAWRRLQALKRYADDTEIPWVQCENIAPERLCSRGLLAPCFRTQKIALVGCGAIGSCLADHLVRSGAQDVALFDKEDFEPGNHARHVLTGNSFEVSKATALKQHLQSGSIHTRLRSFSVTIPNFRSVAGGEALAALRECDVIIDCSAHESAFRWLSKFGADEKKQVVHMFISFEARFLTLVFSGRNVPASLALKSFAQQSRSGSFTALNQSDLDEYWKDPDKEKLVIPGAGCWHATFPARWNHIQCLVGAAIDMIEQRLSAPQLSSGFVAIAKRSDLKLAARGSTPVIEWLYQSPHR